MKGNSPKENEDKLRRSLNAWKTLAAANSFGGATVEQFEATIKPSFDARTELEANEDQRTHLMNKRDNADEVSLAALAKLVANVNADPAFGNDSSLIEAMGYVRKSERATGLTRKGKEGGGSLPPAP